MLVEGSDLSALASMTENASKSERSRSNGPGKNWSACGEATKSHLGPYGAAKCMKSVRNDVTRENGDCTWGVGQTNQRNCIWDEGDGLFLSKCPSRCFGCAAFCWCRSMHMGCRIVWLTEEDNPDAFWERKWLKADAVPSLFLWSEAWRRGRHERRWKPNLPLQ